MITTEKIREWIVKVINRRAERWYVEDITNTQVDELLDNAQRLIVANALREELA